MVEKYRDEIKALLMQGYREDLSPDVVQLKLMPILARCFKDAGENVPYTVTIAKWNDLVIEILSHYILDAEMSILIRTVH